ncbi:MAG: DUF1573 domain-containing protein [Cytophagales bacterium]|nr:MAG: DUF1573 domain-containing protein [Cytophagales bacterium]TAF61329.1 MAG: DUF1573 domain-containing protein [Cytophagales bacterium]
MKKQLLFTFIFLMFVSVAAMAQDYASFKWDKTTHEFGNIAQNKPVSATFTFTNNSKVPMIISNARGSCGCTGVKFPTEPIAPGETGEISATFNAAAVGAFHKTITVTANVIEGAAVLNIKGTVQSEGGGN